MVFSKLTSTRVLSIVAVMVLAFGMGIAVIALQQQQNTRSRASESTANVVTNYSVDFSGSQGQKGWWYGYSDGAYVGTNFQQMGSFNGIWQVDPNKYWIQISRENMHPNSTTTSWPRQPARLNAVKRWVSTVAGPITISGTVADLDSTDSGSGEDGVYFSIWVDANKIWEGHLNNGDTNGVTYDLNRTVTIGSKIDFAVDADNNDYNDTIRFDVIVTQAPTPTTKISLDLLMHGIGKAGDSVLPGEAGGGNPDPKHRKREATVSIYTTGTQPILTKKGNVEYNNTSGSFKGTIDMGNLAAGDYIVKVKLSQSLNTQLGQLQTIKVGQDNPMPQTGLVTGDISNDNAISVVNLSDYNIFLGCFTAVATPETCKPDQAIQSDLDDDLDVDDFDFNLFIRELTTVTR